MTYAQALDSRRARAAEMQAHAAQHVFELRVGGHTVRLGHPISINTCTCLDFFHRGNDLAKHPTFAGLPCVHLLFAFRLVNNRDWVQEDDVLNGLD